MARTPQQLRLWGLMFQDGSVRCHWSGRTQEQRAREERERLSILYPGDEYVVVHRKSHDHPWLPADTPKEQ